MAAPDIIPHDKITKEEFNKLLDQYPDVVEAISQSKRAKDGQKTLSELDQFRYVDALKTFGGINPQRGMTLDDVKLLVEWKLRHGKFRPSLMNLVSSNPPDLASQTIQNALAQYPNTDTAITTLSTLRGIGPATASLLLTVHKPENVIFFSDEAFYWLCCNGKKAPIKYNPKEYLALRTEAEKLAKRIGVSATMIEKVSYVLFKGQQPGKDSKESSAAGGKDVKKAPVHISSGKRKGVAPTQTVDLKQDTSKVDAKEETSGDADSGSLRRSKRLRK